MTLPEGGREFIRVYGRVCPPTKPQNSVVAVSKDTAVLRGVGGRNDDKVFQFDGMFAESATQDEVFTEVADRIVRGCIEGYNGTIFAYGQTGSGKTHTMLGPSTNGVLNSHQRGLIPRALTLLFELLEEKKQQYVDKFNYMINCSFVELYNEAYFDLLGNNMDKLRVRQDAQEHVYIEDVVEERVITSTDAMRFVEQGWHNRRVGETAMNRESSRSHAVFIIKVRTEVYENGVATDRTSQLNMVDLAGSEKLAHSKSTGVRLQEASNINKSLTVLGRSIRILSLTPDKHVPYRESQLTFLLKDSLGGNSRTAVMVTMHPELEYYSDTLSTLTFAKDVRMIKNKVVVNEDLRGDSVLAFKNEIKRLKEEMEEWKRIKEEEERVCKEQQQNEVIRWKKIAVEMESRWEMARNQKRQWLTLSSKKERIDTHSILREEEELWKQREQIALSAPLSASVLEMEVRALREDLSQAIFERDEMQMERDGLRTELQKTREQVAVNLSSPRRNTLVPSQFATPSETKKDRRRTRFTPAHNRKSTLRPVFDQNDRVDQLFNEEQENTPDQELMQLECELNTQKQLVTEREVELSMIRNEYEEHKKEVEQENQRIRVEKEKCEAELEMMRSANKKMAVELIETRKKMDTLKEQRNDERDKLREASDRVALLSVELSECQQAVDGLKAELEMEKELKKKEMDEMRQNIHKTLTQKEQNEVAVREQFDALTQHNKEFVEQIEEEQKRNQILSELVKELTGQHDVTDKKMKELVAECSEQRESIDDLKKTVNQYENTLTEREAQLKELREELDDEMERNKKTLDYVRREHQKEVEEMRKRMLERDSAYEQTMERTLKAERDGHLRIQEDLKEKLRITEQQRDLAIHEKEKDDKDILSIVSHNNPHQKINYIDKIRAEMFEIKNENARLKAKLDRVKKSANH